MKMTKKALTAMIAVSIAATTLPAAAMVSNLSNTLTSSNSAGTNNTTPQDANTAPQNTATAPAATPETSAQTGAPAVQTEPSAESMFITEDVDGGVAITGFKTDDANFTSSVVIPPTIGGKTVVSLKSNNDIKCMTGADKITSLDTSLCNSLSIGRFAFNNCSGITGSVDLSKCTDIGSFAFNNCSGITGSVDLSSCTSIKKSTFSGCKGITSVDLSKCTEIGSNAFAGCSGITGSIDLSKCTSIEQSAFYGCSGITGSVDLSKCTSIGYSAFRDCSGITGSVDLSKCTSIGDYAFSGCKGITGSVDLSSCTSIKKSTFSGCKGITSVDLSKCTDIGSSAFAGCSGITGSIDLSKCTSVGSAAFYGCSGITDVTWSSSQKTIPADCFTNCTNLKTFNSETDGECNLSNITTIEDYAFNGCSSITNVIWSSTQKTIPSGCFSGCTSLKTFNSDTDFNLFGITSIGNNAFRSCSDITGSVDLSSCTSIGEQAFSNCYGITGSVDLSSCTSIGNSAFRGCKGITSVDLSKCTSIEQSAFYGCSGITGSVDLSKCTSIGYSAFRDCSGITGSVDLSKCTSIGDYAFSGCKGITGSVDLSSCTSIKKSTFSGCKGITSVDLSKCTDIGSSAFAGCSGITGSIDLSKCTSVGSAAFYGCSGITDVTWSSSQKTIPADCFTNCTNLKTFNSETDGECNLSNITTIEDYAFNGCSSITNVIWSSTQKTIPSGCFSGCTSLKTFNSDTDFNLFGITSIGNNAFRSCSDITGSVDLSSCTSIGEQAFSNCYGITGSVDLSSCTSIGNSAFRGCKGITSVDLSKCTSIGYFAFSGCKGITGSVDLSNCTSIGNYAFYGCTNLTPTISTKATKVGDNAFKDCPYVTIQAADEDALVSYCSEITSDSDNLKGLSSVKKVADIPGVTDATGLSYNVSNLAMDANATYYLDISVNSECNIDYYKTEAAYDVTLKSIANGATEATAVAGDIPLTIQIPADQYDQGRTYYLSTDTTSPIRLTEQDGYYTYSYTPTLSSTDKNTVAIVSQSPVSNITINGDKNLTYGMTSTEYTATVEPTDAKPDVTWSSNNDAILRFEDPTDGTATIVGLGKATITATATDGSGVTDTLNITVNKAEPTITLNDKKAEYTGSPIEMNGAEVTLVNGETYTDEITYNYYSDAECQNKLEGAPTNVGTYYVTASTREQANYVEVTSDPATLTITPIDMSGVSADGFDGKYDGQPHSITVTGQLDGATVQYYEGDYSTVEDPATITWVDENPAYTNVCKCTVSYKVTDPNGNYNEVKGSATINISQADVPVPTAAPELDSKTVDSVTLKTVEGGTTQQGDEYSVQYGIDKDGAGTIVWQDTNIFTNLERGTEYTFYIRNHITDTSKTANYTENGYSSASQGVNVTTEDVTPPATGEGYIINYKEETITILNGYEVATNQSFDDNVKLNSDDKITPGSTIYVRFAKTTDVPASVGTENKIDDRPAAPTAKPEITQTAKMIQVTNGADGQEYMFKKPTDTNHTATFDVWQDSPVLIDDNMTDDAIYTVTTRVKATDTTFASEEINSTYQTQNIPENGVRLDGGSTGTEWKDMEDSSKTYNADTPYEIPLYLQTKGGDTYMVEIDWGDMLFAYNFGTWDTETLSYDDPSKQGWTTSFDGVNNEVTVINRSSNAIESTIGLTVDADKQAELEHLGFHLTSDNKNSEDSNDYYPTEAKTLQKGSTGNSTTAYVNIKSDDTKPNDSIANKYNKEVNGTQIGNITVTVQKHANP